MKMPEFLDVDPRTLHVPSGRAQGADPRKLARQIAKHGSQVIGMPAIWVTRAKDGALIINDGVTRATRIAKLSPGQFVRVEVIEERPKWNVSSFPTVGGTLP